MDLDNNIFNNKHKNILTILGRSLNKKRVGSLVHVSPVGFTSKPVTIIRIRTWKMMQPAATNAAGQITTSASSNKALGQSRERVKLKGFQGKQGGKWDQNPNFQGMQGGMGLPAFSQGMQGAQQFQYQQDQNSGATQPDPANQQWQNQGKGAFPPLPSEFQDMYGNGLPQPAAGKGFGKGSTGSISELGPRDQNLGMGQQGEDEMTSEGDQTSMSHEPGAHNAAHD